MGARKLDVAPAVPAAAPRTIAIVGAGAAGDSAAATLRREGLRGRRSPLRRRRPRRPSTGPICRRTTSRGRRPRSGCRCAPESFFEERRIDFAVGARVTGVSLRARGELTPLADGTTVGWDALLLATGAEPVRLTAPGGDLPHVHTLRTLADARAIIARAKDQRAPPSSWARGFIGLEAAASLRTRGLDVHVVAPDDVPFALRSTRGSARFLRGVHEEARREVPPRTDGRVGRGAPPSCCRGEQIASRPADLVVVGIGVQAHDRARRGGRPRDRSRRRRRPRTPADEAAPGVFAAGEHRRAIRTDPRGERVRIEHWAVAQRMGPRRRAQHAGPQDAVLIRALLLEHALRLRRSRTWVTPRAGTASTSRATSRRATRRSRRIDALARRSPSRPSAATRRQPRRRRLARSRKTPATRPRSRRSEANALGDRHLQTAGSCAPKQWREGREIRVAAHDERRLIGRARSVARGLKAPGRGGGTSARDRRSHRSPSCSRRPSCTPCRTSCRRTSYRPRRPFRSRPRILGIVVAAQVSAAVQSVMSPHF